MREIFLRNPSLEKLFKTSDGNLFYKETDARAHARSLASKDVQEVRRWDAIEVKGKPEKKAAKDKPEKKAAKDKPVKLNALEAARLRIEAINELNTVEEVEQALSEETAKSVLKAGAGRIAAIQASEALNAENHPNVTETE